MDSRRHTEDLELRELKRIEAAQRRQDQLDRIHFTEQTINAASSINLGFIFGSFLESNWHLFLESIGKFIMFPIAAGMDWARVAMSMRKMHLDRNHHGNMRKRHILTAVIDVVTATAVSAAVGGGLILGGAIGIAFAVVAPILFTAVMGMKALYHGLSALWFKARAVSIHPEHEIDLDRKQHQQEKKNHFNKLAAGHAIGCVATALFTVAVAGAMVALKFAIAATGVLAAVIGIGVAVKNLFFSRQQAVLPTQYRAAELSEDDLLDQTPSPSPTQRMRRVIERGARNERVMPVTLESDEAAQPLLEFASDEGLEAEEKWEEVPLIEGETTPRSMKVGGG